VCLYFEPFGVAGVGAEPPVVLGQHGAQPGVGVAPPAPTLRQLLGCSEREAAPRYGQRGDYWVLYNYVQAEERAGCADAITYTTHGDHTFLDNLAPLLERWQGPVSMSVFAPGADWAPAMAAIQHVRHCSPRAHLIRRWVTFHLYFPSKHVPKKVSIQKSNFCLVLNLFYQLMH
jgi:hypothetical protein